MHALVTGAAGFIGSHLSDALLARGDRVTGVDNFDAFYPREVKERNLAGARRRPGFALHELDIHDVSQLARLLTPETVVIHLAARAGVRPSIADPVGYAHANVAGTAAVVEAMRQAGATRLVFGSSSSVYGNSTPAPFREDAVALEPVSPYAATKRACELLLAAEARLFGLRVASLRFFTVYGPRQRPDLAIHAFARRISDGETVTLFGTGAEARDYTFCSDIVSGVMSAIDWTGRVPAGTLEHFNLGGDHPVPLDEMVRELAGALGIEPRIARAPMQPGDVNWTAADLTKSGAVLGYAPRTPFPEGIQRFVAWFREIHALAN
jgi:UDP-glucuronate 4-epimerase